MKGVQGVKAWKTSAGIVYARRRDAERAQMKLELEKILDDNGVGRGGEWDQDMIIEFMIENAFSLTKCLNIICSPDEEPRHDGPSAL